MALTATEQLKLVSGEVKPPQTDLLTLVHQTAFIFAKSFYDTYKEFQTDNGANPPIGINSLASSYLNKMLGTCRSILRNDINTIQRINRMIIVIIGASVPDLATVENATQEQWESFVLDKMDESLEYVSDVMRNEKAEYLAL